MAEWVKCSDKLPERDPNHDYGSVDVLVAVKVVTMECPWVVAFYDFDDECWMLFQEARRQR